MPMTIDPVVMIVARMAAILLFASSFVHKLRDLPGFLEDLRDYRLLPEALQRPGGVVLIVSEALVVWLCVRGDKAGLILASTLLVMYALAMAINLLRGRDSIDCGCGAKGQPIGWPLVLRNVLVAGLLYAGALSIGQRNFGALDVGLALLVVIASTLLYLTVNQLISNHAALMKARQTEAR